MPRRMWVTVFALCTIFVAFSDFGSAQTLKEIVFQESLEDFPNPERGFYRARELPKPENFGLRGENITLIYGRVSADSFRYKPLPDEFLQAIQNGFDEARKNGIKVNPRVTYNYGPHPGKRSRYGDDAPKETIMMHISQLKPLWEKTKTSSTSSTPGLSEAGESGTTPPMAWIIRISQSAPGAQNPDFITFEEIENHE